MSRQLMAPSASSVKVISSVALSVIACDSCNNVNPPTYYKSQVVFQFAKGYLERIPTTTHLIPSPVCTILRIHRKGCGRMTSSDGSRCIQRPGEVAET